MQVTCPSCSKAVRVLEQDPFIELDCPFCGKVFAAAAAEPSPSDTSLQSTGDQSLDSETAGLDPIDESDDPIPRQIDRHRIIGVLGEGGFGRVYLAHDTQLNRQVAIKVASKRLLASPQSVKALLDEARAVANLKHPGIVQVYDVQVDVPHPFIVQELIKGHDLGTFCKKRRPSYNEATRLIKEVAQAVGFAHQNGFVHRDLKPSNVLVDAAGKPHVADFGLAIHDSVQGARVGEVVGTPAWMAPEQLRGETHLLDGRTDIWALGVIFYELLVDHRPFEGQSRDEVFDRVLFKDARPLRQLDPNVPGELERICLKCLEKRAGDRYSSAASFIDDLDDYLGRLPAEAKFGVDTNKIVDGALLGPNPYRGLGCFTEEDTNVFFGRKVHVERVAERVRDQYVRRDETKPRLVAVLGPSGCGKSSIVRAGVIPSLASIPFKGCKGVRIVTLTPTSRPIDALADALARTAIPTDPAPIAKSEEFATVLREFSNAQGATGLRRISDMLPNISHAPLLLVVDQFEEIYTLCRDDEERQLFLDNLIVSSRDLSGHVSVLITLRSDFIANTQKHQDLNSTVAEQSILIPSMNDDELRSAITEPALSSGLVFDKSFVELLVKETSERQGGLPLLQFALTKVWEARLEGQEPANALERLGGIGGALAREADRIYEELADADKDMARRAFLGLVRLGEGSPDTRRRVPIDQLMSIQDDSARFRKVLNRFAATGCLRLITLSALPDDPDRELAEVTHEALFANWQRLRDWLDESRAHIRFMRKAEDAANHWEQQEFASGLLWRTPTLDLLDRAYERSTHDFTKLQVRFLLASKHAAKKQRWLRRISAGFVVVTLMTVSVLSWFVIQSQGAARTARLQQQVTKDVDSIGANWSSKLPRISKKLVEMQDEPFTQQTLVRCEKHLQDQFSRAFERPGFPLEVDLQQKLESDLSVFETCFPNSIAVDSLREQLRVRVSEAVVVDLTEQIAAASISEESGHRMFDNVVATSDISVAADLEIDGLGEFVVGLANKRGKTPRYEFGLTPGRNESLLAWIRIDDQIAKAVPVRYSQRLSITATRKMNSLQFKVGENVVSHYELFADHVTPVHLEIKTPLGFSCSQLSATYRSPPSESNLAQKTDVRFLNGEFREALQNYRQLASSTTSGATQKEFLLKEAFCLNRIPGEDRQKAHKILSDINHVKWSPLAAYEILRTAIDNHDITKTDQAYFLLTEFHDKHVYSPKELWSVLGDEMSDLMAISGQLRRTADELQHIETIVRIAEFAPPNIRSRIYLQAARAHAVAGKRERAKEFLNYSLQRDRNFADAGVLVDAVADIARIALLDADENQRPHELLQVVNRLEAVLAYASDLSSNSRGLLKLRIAQLQIATGDETLGSEADGLLRELASQPLRSGLSACKALLLLGFRESDADARKALWKRGYILSRQHRSQLTNVMLGSLSDDLTFEDARRVFVVLSFVLQPVEWMRGKAELYNELHIAMKEMYQDEQGMSFARRVARGQCGFAETMLQQAAIGLHHGLRQTAFSDYSAEQKELVHDFVAKAMRAWVEHRIDVKSMAPVATAWWIPIMVEFDPKHNELNDQLAYLLGCRNLHQNSKRLAEKYFLIASQSADPTLQKLAIEALEDLRSPRD